MINRMTLSIHNRRLFAQHARPKDTALPYAENAAIAADMLRGDADRVQIAYDVEIGREVKRLLRAANVIAK